MANTRQSNEPGYNRSVGGGLLRGGLLLLVAVVVGAVLLQQTKEKNSATPEAPSTTTTTTITVDTGTGTGITPTPDPGVPVTTVVLRAPALVKVLVVNGSGVNRAAARVRAAMSTTGYNLLPATDANANNFADSVLYAPGFEGEARQIATILGGIDPANLLVQTPPLPIKPPIPDADIVVMVGQNLMTKYKTQQLGTGTVGGTAAAVAGGAATAAQPTSTKKKRRTTTTKVASAATGRARSTPKTTKAPATADATPTAATRAAPAATVAPATPAAEATVARVPVVTQPAN